MRVLITGGAGFIGTNLASHFIQKGWDVLVLDDLSRYGTAFNLDYLRSLNGNFEFLESDIRDYSACECAVKGCDLIYHLAAQVAVTTSVTCPRHDFEVNLLGTLNLLEAVRNSPGKPFFVFTSTNKVYGEMRHMAIHERNNRWEYASLPHGNPESTPLDFYSPYGCSKGGADQYVLDYARIYGLDTVVFRMSCIYGPRQMGCEDQGWVAFFLIRAALKQGITLFGDGKQIRDILYISDLVDALVKAYENRDVTRGQAYNIGGGPEQTMSLLEFVSMITTRFQQPLPFTFADWRPGDQKVYVSDIRKAYQDLKWTPQIRPEKGIKTLHEWVQANRALFEHGIL